MKRASIILSVWLSMMALILSSCSVPLQKRHMAIKMIILSEANQNTPIAIDLLFVYDKTLLERLRKMRADEWFDQRDEIQQDYPDGMGFTLAKSWELVPDQDIQDTFIKMPTRLIKNYKGMIFANYLSPGPHRIEIDPGKDIILTLDKKGVKVRSFHVED